MARWQHPDLKPLLTFPEAADLLGCPVADLWAAWHAGKFRALNPLGRWRIDPKSLESIREVLTPAPTRPVEYPLET